MVDSKGGEAREFLQALICEVDAELVKGVGAASRRVQTNTGVRKQVRVGVNEGRQVRVDLNKCGWA